MTSRRAFLALGGAAVAGAALSGCSTSTSGSGSGSGSGAGGSTASTGGGGGGGKPLSVYVSQQASFPQEQKAWFARVQKAFQAKTGHGIQYETYTAATEEQQRIQTSVVSGTGPDVYEIGTTFTPTAFATKSFVRRGRPSGARTASPRRRWPCPARARTSRSPSPSPRARS